MYMDAGQYINMLSNRMRRHSCKFQEQLGLTREQGNILSFVLLEGEKRKLYQKDVEREFDLRPSTATGLLNALEKKGLLCRISDDQDGRYKILHATKQGELLRKSLQEEIRELEANLVRGIDAEELENFKRASEKMLKNLER